MNARRLRRGLALRPPEQRLAVEALVLLAVSRAVLAVLPFRVAVRWLGLRLAREIGHEQADEATAVPTIRQVRDAVRRAAGVAPFRAVCLQQAVAAALMLRRRGLAVQVHFGVTKDADGKLLAHAWSRCQGELVTGGQQMPEYQPISVFVT